jgi:membrane protein DedA with SNARE-associated domain
VRNRDADHAATDDQNVRRALHELPLHGTPVPVERLAARTSRRYHGGLPWHAKLVGLFVLLVFGGLGVPPPEDLTLIGAGILARQHVLAVSHVIAVSLAAVMSADWIIYLVGRRYGRDIVGHPWLARRFGAHRLDAVEQAVERHGVRAVFAARFMFGFRIVTYLAAGTFRVSPLGFAISEGLSAAIFAPAMVTLGFLFSDRAEKLMHDLGQAQHWLLLAGVVGLALYLGLRAWVSRTGLAGEGPERAIAEPAPTTPVSAPPPAGAPPRGAEGRPPTPPPHRDRPL